MWMSLVWLHVGMMVLSAITSQIFPIYKKANVNIFTVHFSNVTFVLKKGKQLYKYIVI